MRQCAENSPGCSTAEITNSFVSLSLRLLLYSQPYLWGLSFWVRYCTLGVFLLKAFTHLGHECQDLLSPCNGMQVCTNYTSVYTLIRKNFGGMESEPMLTPSEESSLPKKFSSEEDRTHDAASTGQRAQHTTNELFRPPPPSSYPAIH